MLREYLDRGGSVLVPQAPEEPDQRIDKMTGLPYDQQAGGAFVDEEDRLKFAAAGIVSLFKNIRRLSRGAKDIVADTRPVTRFDTDQQFKDTLIDLRYRKPDNFIDPNSTEYSVSKITVDTPENVEGFTKFLGKEENINLRVFNSLEEAEQSAMVETFRSASPQNEFVGIKTTRKPTDKYWKDTKNTKDRISKEVDDDLSRIPQEDLKYAQEYADSVPRKSSKPPALEDALVTKQEFLEGSVEKGSQWNGSFFSKTKYDNDLSTAIPRELGLHVGTETHARTILIRKSHPLYDAKIEEDAIRRSILKGQTRDEARTRAVNEGVDDDIVESNLTEMYDRVPIGVETSLRKGFINVKNPLIIETDFIDWNPAKFLGGKDDFLKTLSKQAQDLEDAIKAQVKLTAAQVSKITDEAMEKINFFVRKKDMNSDEFMNDVYNFHINKTTKTMLEDLGFDSIKYKNLGELTKRSERQAGGGYSYILFNKGQFKTSFKQADDVVGDFVPKVKVKGGKVVTKYAGVSKIEVVDEAEALQRAFPEEYAGKSKENILADKQAFKESRKGLGFPRRRDELSPENVRTYQETQYKLARGIIPQIDQFKVMSELLPVSRTTVMPERNTFNLLETSQVLKTNQLKNHGILDRTMRIEEGTLIASRIDIPVWDNYGVKAVTLHSGRELTGDPIGYALHASQKNVTFTTQQQAASHIGRGLTDKGTIARVSGGWVNRTFDETYDLIKEIVENPTKYSDWVQVKMNPDIHSWFMDASTGLPLSRADDYLKVGDLAFAKNAVMPNGVLAQDTLTKYGSVLEAAEDIFNSKGFKEEFGYEAVGFKTPPKPIGGIDTPKEFYEGAKASPVSTTYNTGGKVLGSLQRTRRFKI